jgi:hypothetical protein
MAPWMSTRPARSARRAYQGGRADDRRSARITARQEAWFIERARGAPWDLVAPDALLGDADAAQPDGLYDTASALRDHFWADRPAGVAVAKISKVLYLMRPALFPILAPAATGSASRSSGPSPTPTPPRSPLAPARTAVLTSPVQISLHCSFSAQVRHRMLI